MGGGDGWAQRQARQQSSTEHCCAQLRACADDICAGQPLPTPGVPTPPAPVRSGTADGVCSGGTHAAGSRQCSITARPASRLICRAWGVWGGGVRSSYSRCVCVCVSHSCWPKGHTSTRHQRWPLHSLPGCITVQYLPGAALPPRTQPGAAAPVSCSHISLAKWLQLSCRRW
jgi:hypothetical protein